MAQFKSNEGLLDPQSRVSHLTAPSVGPINIKTNNKQNDMSQTCYPNLSSEANKANVLKHLSKRALV